MQSKCKQINIKCENQINEYNMSRENHVNAVYVRMGREIKSRKKR